MTGVVLSFPSGEVISHPEDAQARLNDPQEIIETNEPVALIGSEHNRNILDRIEKLRHLAIAGRLDGLILIASDPVTGYFLTDHNLLEDQDRSDLFGFIGVLETLKSEITEQTAMAPCITMSGEILDPYDNEE